MGPTAVPTRITVDFRDSIHPSRTWILGIGDEGSPRVELLAFEPAEADATRTWMRTLPRRRPAALTTDCTCPDFCERDHANE